MLKNWMEIKWTEHKMTFEIYTGEMVSYKSNWLHDES